MAYQNERRTLVLPSGAGPTDARIVLDGDTGQIIVYAAGGDVVALIDSTGIYAMNGDVGDPNSYVRMVVDQLGGIPGPLLEMRPLDTNENEAFAPGGLFAYFNDETDEAGRLLAFSPIRDGITSPVASLELTSRGVTSTRTNAELAGEDVTLSGRVLVPTDYPMGTWKRNANQSIANNTLTDITMPAEEYDTDGMLTPTSAVCTIPAGADGIYEIDAWVMWGPSSVGFRRLVISINNTINLGFNSWDNIQTSPGNTGQSLNIKKALVGGDNVRIKGLQTSGAALNIENARLSVTKKLGTS